MCLGRWVATPEARLYKWLGSAMLEWRPAQYSRSVVVSDKSRIRTM